MTAPQYPPRMRLVKSRMRLVKADTPEWEAIERARVTEGPLLSRVEDVRVTEEKAPTVPSRWRLVKASDVKTCPKCGQDRVIPGPAYDRGAWRCFGCGASPSKPKGPKPKGKTA